MRKGESIRNSITGETITMLIGEEETNGARQLYQVRLPSRRPRPPVHYHLAFIETFSVIEGKLDIYVGRERKHLILGPGESATAHIRELHTFANERDTPALITIDTRPAGSVVRAFQLAYGVANEGGAAPDGLPKNLLVRLLFVRLTEGFVPSVPLPLQKAVLGMAAFVARVTGVLARLDEYFSSSNSG